MPKPTMVWEHSETGQLLRTEANSQNMDLTDLDRLKYYLYLGTWYPDTGWFQRRKVDHE